MAKRLAMKQLPFLLEDSEIIQKVSPYFMARIVDVKEFLLRYPFVGNDFQLRLAVSDRIVAWNNGTFVITVQEGKVSVDKISETLSENAIHLTVQTLATMLLGYKRPSYLEKIERLQGNTIEIALLETVLPVGIPTFIDYF